jgi:hypothetical protein
MALLNLKAYDILSVHGLQNVCSIERTPHKKTLEPRFKQLGNI